MSQSLNFKPQLRKLRPEDSKAMHEIEKRVYSEPWSQSLLEDSLRAAMTYGLGLFIDQQLIAYAIYQVILEEGHLLNLATDDKFQKQGVGAALLDELIKECRRLGALTIFLEVRVSNHAAQELYKKKAFKPLMLRENYYADGESALMMILDLEEAKTN